MSYDCREVDFGDVDNDGDVDLFFTARVYAPNPSGPPGYLLVNDGAGSFADVTSTSIPNVADRYCFDGDFGDINGDGDLDIFIATGDPSQGLTLLVNQSVPGKFAAGSEKGANDLVDKLLVVDFASQDPRPEGDGCQPVLRRTALSL